MSDDYNVVDTVSRETAEMLRETDATLAWADDQVYVIEPRHD